MFLAPALARLGELCRRFGEGLAELADLENACRAALKFSRENRHVFERVAVGIVIDRPVADLQHQYRLELDAQEEALRKLLDAAREGRERGLQEALGTVLSTAGRCMEIADQMRAEEEKRPRFSPHPELDHFIKAGINVLNGAATLVEIECRMPTIIALVEQNDLDVERFRRLYGHPDLVQPTVESLAQMRAGLGAVSQSLRESEPQALLDGLKLLGMGSTSLAQSLLEFEKIADEARFPYLNELHLGQERLHPETDRAIFRALWARVEKAFYHYENEVRSVKELALFPLLEAVWSRTDAAVRELGRELTKLAPQWAADPTGVPLGGLEKGFERVRQGLEEMWRRLESELTRLDKAPQFAMLRELVLRLARGAASTDDFKRALEHNRKIQEELLAELPEGELADLLTRQGQAYAEMERFLEDDDPAHLTLGWSMLDQTLPRMIEMVSAVPRREAPRPVGCFRCGTVNPPGAGFCKQCKAALGGSTGPTEYTDITTPPEVTARPSHLVRLEELVHGLENGSSTREELYEEIDKQLDRADNIWRQFEAQVVPLTGTDPVLDAYVNFFADQISTFMEGLVSMREGSLRGGLATCWTSGTELVGLKARIEGALKAR